MDDEGVMDAWKKWVYGLSFALTATVAGVVMLHEQGMMIGFSVI
jgi:hypothetical protein